MRCSTLRRAARNVPSSHFGIGILPSFRSAFLFRYQNLSEAWIVEGRLHSESHRSHKAMMTPHRTAPAPAFPFAAPLRTLLLTLAAILGLAPIAPAQTITGPQQLTLAALRSVANQGQFNAVKTDPAGNLYLLLDQKDGVRLLKLDPTASTILAQSQLGAKGDIGLALAFDPAGNLYVAGTTTSTTLNGTRGAAFPNRADTSTNSFVAKYDANLNNLFVTFAGSGRLAATAVTATADAVFLTGSLFAATLPVTPNAILQAPARGSLQNGFVERFSSDGATLVYATYLTGANGDTSPSTIAADSSDNTYIAGYTSASGYPTLAALSPRIAPGTPSSGFLTKLPPAADGITFSTFIPGTGVSSLALDPATQNLLLAGNVDLGLFPVATVQAPLVATPYQVLLRLPLDGSSVLASTILAPGTQSFVTPGPNGSTWVDGALTIPLLPLTPIANTGTAFAAHITSTSLVDQTLRLGGLVPTNPSFASAPVGLTSLATDPAGQPLFAGAFTPTASSSLLPTQTYDLPLLNAPTPALPSAVSDAALPPGSCNGSACSGSAAYLARITTGTASPSLALSIGSSPDIVLRNLGSAMATGLQVTATGFTLATTCANSLPAGAECAIALSGSGPGTVTATASNAPTQTATLPASGAAPTAIVFSPRELDFGIQTASSAPILRTVTVTNLSQQTQTFTSALDFLARSTTPPFTEASSDCPAASPNTKTLPTGATCHIILAFALNSTVPDGPLQYAWTIATSGARDVVLTGFAQAAALSPSASTISFGTQFVGGLRVPRFLYLSNNSDTALPHTPVALPAGSPFTVTDRCPTTLLPHSVCQLQLAYNSPASPTDDSVTLTLDQGLSVLLTGQTLPQPTANGAAANPSLAVTPASINFSNAVPVTATSVTTQTVTVTNTGATPFALSLVLTGDFTDTTSCTGTLAAHQSCSVVLTFAPTAPGTRAGLLAVTAGAGTSPSYVDLTGTATPILPPNNGTLDLGAIPLTEPTVQWFKISQPFQNFSASTTGAFKVLFVEDIGYGHGNPPPNAFLPQTTGTCLNCFLGIQFQPTVTGFQTGSLSLASASLASPYQLTLTGTGLPFLGLIPAPNAQDFGPVPVNSTSQPLLLSLANLLASTGTAGLTLSSVTTSGDFALSSAPTGGAPCTGTLPLTNTCLVQVTFSPTSTGPRTGTLTFVTTSGNVTAALTGFGSPDPGIGLSPTALTFLNVPGPTSTQQILTVANTGSSPIQVAQPTVTGTAFATTGTCATLAPAATCTLAVTYTPGSAPTTATLSLPVTTMAGGVATTTAYPIPLTGAYTSEDAGLQFVPAQVNFGPAPTDNLGLTRTFTLNNLTAKSVNVAFTLPRQFALTTPNACLSLAANASCDFAVTYLPLTTADTTGTLFAQATPTDNTAPLNGLGYLEAFGTAQINGTLSITGPLSPGTGILDFGQIPSGQSSTKTLTLTNTSATIGTLGAPPITVRRITTESPFLATTTCGSALAAAQSCTITVTYTPLNQIPTGVTPTTQPNTGTLIVESGAVASPNLIDLAGTAAPVAVNSPANNAPIASYTLSQGALTFPGTSVGNPSPTQTVTVANTGSVTLHLSALLTTPDFTVFNACPAALVPAATCTFTVAFTPRTTGIHSSALQITSDASDSLEFVSLFGVSSPASLQVGAQALDFGTVLVGATASQPVQITNNGQVPVTFNSITATGDYTAAGNCPVAGASLAPGTSCTVQVTFAPVTAGTRPGTLSLATSATTLPLTVALTGIGAQSHLQVTPGALAFGSIAVAASANLSLTLTNNGTAPVNRLALAVTGDYAITTPCTITTLAPLQTCSVTLTFTPTQAGARPGTVTVTSSDSTSPIAVPLTGTGIANGTFALTIDGATTSSATVRSGVPANYTLTITPAGSFAGAVVLNCTPLNPVPYATCAILPSGMTLAGTPQNAAFTITTVTSLQPVALTTSLAQALFCFLSPAFIFIWKKGTRRRLVARRLLWLFLCCVTLAGGGCGGGPNTTLRYVNPGTYQYQVTASSTSGIQITQTVTATVVVTGN